MHSAWAYLLAKQALYQLSYGPVFCYGMMCCYVQLGFRWVGERPKTAPILAQSAAAGRRTPWS